MMQSRPKRDDPTQQQLSVLIVDDDPLVSVVLSRQLSPFRVTFAQSAAGAFGRLQAGGKFDAILCDIHMPGMNGMQFYEEVAKVSPPLASRIIFISGGAFSPEAADFLERTRNLCLTKPVNREALKNAVMAAASETKIPAAALDGRGD